MSHQLKMRAQAHRVVQNGNRQSGEAEQNGRNNIFPADTGDEQHGAADGGIGVGRFRQQGRQGGGQPRRQALANPSENRLRSVRILKRNRQGRGKPPAGLGHCIRRLSAGRFV